MTEYEHVCSNCLHTVYNMDPRKPGTCSKCGSMDVRHFPAGKCPVPPETSTSGESV